MKLVLTALGSLLAMSALHAAELTPAQASAFAKLALKGLGKEYPNKLDHVMASADDVKSPRSLHPAFYGSFDWHSSVHGHWMLVRLLRTMPTLPESKAIRDVLNEHLTKENLEREAAYFAKPDAKSFERPYGWAWLLKLAEELHDWDDADAKQWKANLAPLADVIVKRYLDYFPKQTYPTRSGVHSNTAFGLMFAHDYAKATKHARLRELIEERARFYFLQDEDAPAKWEPGGADFFSPVLMEADLMRRVLPADEFKVWFAKFLPKPVFTPATVTDRSDGHLVHLDGLNLSRAWCLKNLSKERPEFAKLAEDHTDASLAHVGSGDYAGEHWLASFAVYLLTK